jgi:lia operon protein LiaG
MNKSLLLGLLLVCTTQFSFGQNVLARHEFDAENINKIKIKGLFCQVVLFQDDIIRFRGIIEGRGHYGDYFITSDYHEDLLLIEVRKKGRNQSKLSKARLKIGLPPNVSVIIENTSGDIKADHIYEGQYNFRSTSGDIFINEAVGDFRLNSTSGDISLRGLAGPVIIKTTSGDQKIVDLSGDLKPRSTSGNISAQNCIGLIEMSATSGDLLFNAVHGGLNVRTTSGDIRGSHVELTKNSYFQTTSGDVVMELENSEDELSFELKGISADLIIGGKIFERSIEVEKGPIRIHGISTSGDQRYSF